MTDNPTPPGGYSPGPPSDGYPAPQPPGGYQSPGGYPAPQGEHFPPPQGGYSPPPPSGYPPPQGNYPPPQGNYPPPGGFPPQGAHAAPQSGYPPQGYPPYGGPPAYSVGDAFGWAWNKFSKNAVPLIVAALVFGVLVVLLQAVINILQVLASPGDTSYTADDSGFSFSYNATGVAGILIAIVGWIVSLIVTAAIQSAFLSGVLDIANGQEVSVGSFFKPRNIGNVVIAGVLVGVITTIGAFLCIVPGIIASIMLMFTTVAVLDRNLAPIDALKASFQTSKANFGTVFVAWLVLALTVLVGALLCGVGLLVALPVAALFLVYTYRFLNGASVAPATP